MFYETNKYEYIIIFIFIQKKSEELGKPNEEDKKKRARRLAD